MKGKIMFIIISIVVAFLIVVGVDLAQEQSSQPETIPLNSSLEENIESIFSNEGRVYGTINISGMPLLGSADAPTTIMAFGDFQCLGCKFWFLNIQPNITKNLIETGKANLVFIDAELLGVDSLKASEASYCAEEQGKYWEYHNILYTSQQEINDGWANSENLKMFASDLGLDESLFENCLDSGKYEKKVKFNAFEAKKNGISKIPTFVIIDSKGRHHKITGSVSSPIFEDIIDSFTQEK